MLAPDFVTFVGLTLGFDRYILYNVCGGGEGGRGEKEEGVYDGR